MKLKVLVDNNTYIDQYYCGEPAVSYYIEDEDIKLLLEEINQADAIVIGGGSGLSSASGYNHYHWMGDMKDKLSIFKEHYGFESPFAGFYHCFSSYEEQWAYYSNYIKVISDAPTGKPFEDLKDLVGDKPCFVLTTNVDGQFQRVFPSEQICTFQGDMTYFQCSQPCHDKLYKNSDIVNIMCKNMKDLKVPTELVPRCEKCGRVMVQWVRDDTFLEGDEWKASVKRYENFLHKYLVEEKDKKVLFLELGVGEMSVNIIKLAFWEMTANNDNIFYACLNNQKSQVPLHLKGKGLYLEGDLAVTLNALNECNKKL